MAGVTRGSARGMTDAGVGSGALLGWHDARREKPKRRHGRGALTQTHPPVRGCRLRIEPKESRSARRLRPVASAFNARLTTLTHSTASSLGESQLNASTAAAALASRPRMQATGMGLRKAANVVDVLPPDWRCMLNVRFMPNVKDEPRGANVEEGWSGGASCEIAGQVPALALASCWEGMERRQKWGAS